MARWGTSRASFFVSTAARTFAYWPGRRRFPGLGNDPWRAMVPVCTLTWRLVTTTVPRCGYTLPSSRMSSSVGSPPRTGSAQWLPPAEWRYSVSLMLNWALIGSTCETVVITLDVLIRVPTCAWAMPAMPAMGEVTWVQPRLSSACASVARDVSTVAAASRSAARSLSSCCAGMTCAAISSRSRFTSSRAFARAAAFLSRVDRAWSATAL